MGRGAVGGTEDDGPQVIQNPCPQEGPAALRWS